MAEDVAEDAAGRGDFSLRQAQVGGLRLVAVRHAVGAHRARGRPRGLGLARALLILAADHELGRVGVALLAATVVACD